MRRIGWCHLNVLGETGLSNELDDVVWLGEGGRVPRPSRQSQQPSILRNQLT
jgi:hypothetical protein